MTELAAAVAMPPVAMGDTLTTGLTPPDAVVVAAVGSWTTDEGLAIITCGRLVLETTVAGAAVLTGVVCTLVAADGRPFTTETTRKHVIKMSMAIIFIA